jgi:hypothetical protein
MLGPGWLEDGTSLKSSCLVFLPDDIFFAIKAVMLEYIVLALSDFIGISLSYL